MSSKISTTKNSRALKKITEIPCIWRKFLGVCISRTELAWERFRALRLETVALMTEESRKFPNLQILEEERKNLGDVAFESRLIAQLGKGPSEKKSKPTNWRMREQRKKSVLHLENKFAQAKGLTQVENKHVFCQGVTHVSVIARI